MDEPHQFEGPFLPHSDFGDPECCGLLFAVVSGDLAAITCNECAVVVRTVASADLQRTMDEMESGLDARVPSAPT